MLNDEVSSNVASDLAIFPKQPKLGQSEKEVFPDVEDLHNYFVAFHQKSKMLLQKLELG